MGQMLFAAVAMIVIGFVAWRLVQRQEANDPEFEEKLRADDERAARGRGEMIGRPTDDDGG